jgi:hypothetical protein
MSKCLDGFLDRILQLAFRRTGWNGQAGTDRGEDTNLITLRIRGELGSAVALDDVQDGVLAQPEPMTYFPVGLAFVDEL